MHTSTVARHLVAAFVCAAGITNAAYTIQDTYDASNFFSEFSFFQGTDPTQGTVKYLSSTEANTSSIAGITNNAVYLGVDHTTVNPPNGRGSVRLTSNKAYNLSLFIADIAHMPDSTCGVWPAFWTFGQSATKSWPDEGEIDIIEGVNTDATDTVTLHTASGCQMSGAGSLSGSVLTGTDCNAGSGGTGCSTTTENTMGYGTGFNVNKGGVYAVEWTSTAIQIWFFTRSVIPSDITSGTPDPSTWGTPTASFTGGSTCDIDTHFMNHNIVFDTTFCGGWAGTDWGSYPKCSALASTCATYVDENPSAFQTAFWEINSVKVYSSKTAARKRSVVVSTPFTA